MSQDLEALRRDLAADPENQSLRAAVGRLEARAGIRGRGFSLVRVIQRPGCKAHAVDPGYPRPSRLCITSFWAKREDRFRETFSSFVARPEVIDCGLCRRRLSTPDGSLGPRPKTLRRRALGLGERGGEGAE